MNRKSFLAVLGLGFVSLFIGAVFGRKTRSAWMQLMGLNTQTEKVAEACVANCGAYYTPPALVGTVLAYDPACGTGGFLLSASKTLGDRAVSLA